MLCTGDIAWVPMGPPERGTCASQLRFLTLFTGPLLQLNFSEQMADYEQLLAGLGVSLPGRDSTSSWAGAVPRAIDRFLQKRFLLCASSRHLRAASRDEPRGLKTPVGPDSRAGLPRDLNILTDPGNCDLWTTFCTVLKEYIPTEASRSPCPVRAFLCPRRAARGAPGQPPCRARLCDDPPQRGGGRLHGASPPSVLLLRSLKPIAPARYRPPILLSAPARPRPLTRPRRNARSGAAATAQATGATTSLSATTGTQSRAPSSPLTATTAETEAERATAAVPARCSATRLWSSPNRGTTGGGNRSRRSSRNTRATTGAPTTPRAGTRTPGPRSRSRTTPRTTCSSRRRRRSPPRSRLGSRRRAGEAFHGHTLSLPRSGVASLSPRRLLITPRTSLCPRFSAPQGRREETRSRTARGDELPL